MQAPPRPRGRPPILSLGRAVLEAPWLAPVLRVSPIIVDGSLRDEHILPRLEKPEAQLNRTDLEADKGSLDLIALDDVLVRLLPELDRPLLRAEPEPNLDPTDPHTHTHQTGCAALGVQLRFEQTEDGTWTKRRCTADQLLPPGTAGRS